MDFEMELKEFNEFKKNYEFKPLEIVDNDDGLLTCEGIVLKDNNGYVGESEKWINVGYNFKGMYTKLLSNLFPYKFTCDNNELNSIEAFFQGIKFKDINLQKKVFAYSGKEALVLQKATDYNWKETGIIYWLGNPIKRDSKEYDDLVTRIYISAIQNPFYRNAIKNCDLPIIHVIGEKEKTDTVFTRYEFEFMLNCLHDFLNR